MSLIFAETFDHSGLEILSPQMTLSEVHKRMDDGQNLGQILFDLIRNNMVEHGEELDGIKENLQKTILSIQGILEKKLK